jgi:Uma2 family endonuclease
VRVRATEVLTYPDLTVVCRSVERDTDDPLAAVNPRLLVEVLSESTERYDRGAKFEHYKRLSTLRQYVLVSHRERRLEVWTRDAADDWTCCVSLDGDTAELRSIDATIDVRELYDAAAEPASSSGSP